MAIPQKIIPQKGLDLDSSELYVEELRAVFLKNITLAVNDNERIAQDEGLNQFEFTPLESNSKYCELTLPSGNNYCVGFYYAIELKQAYVFVWNSQSNHLIYRLNAQDGSCQVVVQSSCLNFQLRPEHFIAEGRCVVETACYFNVVKQAQDQRVYLIFTDNYNEPRFISVEDCIATDFFDPNQFPFFNINDAECYRCNLLNLGVPTPLDCLEITPIARDMDDPDELTKVNKLLGNTWQFRIRGEDVWGRTTEHGIISDMYLPAAGSVCAAGSVGQPRCLKLKFKAGCPTIEKLYIEFRNWTGNVRGLATETDWYRAVILEKYDSSDTSKDWWERPINPNITYNAADNTIEYTFCASDERVPIDVSETNRSENPLALTSSSVFKIGKSIALARNTRGFEPLDQKELDKIEFSVIAPGATTVCKPQARTLTFYAILYSWGDEVVVPLRKKNDQIVFGAADCANNNPFAYDQVMKDNQEGFIGCLRGTKYYAISKQCSYDRQTGEIKEVGIDFNWGNPLTDPMNYLRYYPVQKFVIENVLPGNYIFQISSHKATPLDDYMRMSTYTIGRASFATPATLLNKEREILVNCCSADYTDANPFIIYDLTRSGKGCAVVDATSVNAGYIYEDEKSKIPIEGAVIDASVDSAVTPYGTDHNGFYFCATRKRGLKTTIRGMKNCTEQALATGRASRDTADNWYKFDTLYAYKGSDTYPATDRMLIKGKVVECSNSSVGVPGVLVVLAHGGYAVTDSSGAYTIVAHDLVTMVRTDKVVFSQNGSCHILSCTGSCNYCLPSQDFTADSCDNSARIITMSDQGATANAVNKRGPKMGGRYGLGVVLHDWMGRQSFVQALEKHYVDIPTLQQTQAYDFSKIQFNLNGAVFPSWVRRVSFYITENLNYDQWFEWVAERIQFIDNTGNANTAAPSQIRLYYESLGVYNQTNNFSTNSTWQFVDDQNKVVLGDYIEFLAKPDGTIYTERITALVKHDKQGKYVQVDYDNALADLKDGTLVQFVRPKAYQSNQFYYQLCPSIRVENLLAVEQSGTLNFFDSYLQARTIPVPVEVKKTDSSGEIQTTTEYKLNNYPFYYEHHSPSDFWGDHAWNKGRVAEKNPYERRYCRPMEVAVSKVFSNNGVVNGLHYFDEDDFKEYDEQGRGGIVVGLAEDNTVLFICENDNFVATYNDVSVEVREGQVIAPNADDKFGRAQKKIGNNYGCQMADINTIRRKNGIVLFLDGNRSALVYHNYADAVDLSDEGVKSWITAKVKSVRDFNIAGEGIRYFHAGIDAKTREYLLTDSFLEPRPDSTGAACPEGWQLSSDGTTCSRIVESEPTSQQTPIHAAPSTHPVYSQYGTRIYESGFNLQGDGAASEILSPDAFWSNFDSTVNNGPMNRNGIWVDNDNDGVRDALSMGQQLTVTFNLSSDSQKLFYFGVGGDNKIKLTVNGVVIVDKQTIVDLNFKWWHVYPVLLNAGSNLVSVTGEGDGSVQDSMAMEIYENTEAELLAASSYADLNVRFKTADLRGGILQITECQAGYQPINDGGVWKCQKVETQPSTPVDLGVIVPDSKFLNDRAAVEVSVSETLCLDMVQKVFRGFLSFTPEYYGTMEADLYGPQLLSFRLAEAWRHHGLMDAGSSFSTFYGTAVDLFLEVVFNRDNTKVKNYLWNEVYCKGAQWFIESIVTESGQQSRLMPLWWEKRDQFFVADFKCALNTPQDMMLGSDTTTNALLDGDLLYGRWLKARYKLRAQDRTKYFQLTALVGYMNGAEKSG